jgi:hypothetical protein
MFGGIKRTLCKLTIVGALGLGLSVPAQAGDLVLTDRDMDGVVAGLSIDIFAQAFAAGKRGTYTRTDTDTKIVENRFVTIGYGRGEAYAAGRGKNAEAQTAVGAVIRDADHIEIKTSHGGKVSGKGKKKTVTSKSTIEVKAYEYKHGPFSFKSFLALQGRR